jgi:hypothetical protein
LFDELSISRIEIDVLELGGPVFAGVDSRLWCLALLRLGMSHAIVFDSNTQVVEPSGALRKRPLIVLRGTVANAGVFTPEILQASRKQLLAEGITNQLDPAVVLELSIHTIGRANESSGSEMLTHVEQLSALGTVFATDYAEAYHLVHHLRRHTTEPIRMIIGISLLMKVMQERFYEALPGTLLEGLGRLLATNVTIWVVPMAAEQLLATLGGLPEGFVLTPSPDGLVSVDDVVPKPPIDQLYGYLRAAGRIVPLAVSTQKQ